MRTTKRFRHGLWLVVVSLVCLSPSAVRALHAQSTTRCEDAFLFLPPASGGTALSFQIQAEAEYLVARGYLTKSIAVARKIHAEAFAQEIQNSVNYVDAYYQRRELNRKWRAEQNPNYLARETHVQEVRRQRIERQFQDVLKGDLTDELNWLLVELSGPTLAMHYVTGRFSDADLKRLGPVAEDGDIAAADAALIQFSDGRLTFSAADPQILDVRWPLTLQSPEFDSLRDEFTAAREQVVFEIRTKERTTFESGERLIQATNDLLVALDKVCVEKVRHMTPAESLPYLAARRYLKSLTSEVHHAVQGDDRLLTEKAAKFGGGHVIELIRHMDRTGLAFAPPVSGGERVYRRLFSAMRSLYLLWGSNRE